MPTVTIALILTLIALLLTIVAALGRCPLWIPVLFVVLVQLLAVLPSK